MAHATEVVVEGHRLQLSNLNKVFYPADGFTKAQVIDFYRRVAPVLLPHLHDRPVTLKRYPDGVNGSHFYEKRCPVHRPAWIPTAKIWSSERTGHINFCLINDLPTLMWAANLANLEVHTYLHLSSAPARPTSLVFDLDPGPPADLLACARVALLVRELYDTLGLKTWAKTSGSKGIQVYVPLNTAVDYAATKAFARATAELLEKRHPDLVVSNMRKALRTGKVLVDWSQNDAHKTTVSVYSLRAREHPTVSLPVEWTEIEQAVADGDTEPLVFRWDAARDRVERRGDLFAPQLSLRQTLPHLA